MIMHVKDRPGQNSFKFLIQTEKFQLFRKIRAVGHKLLKLLSLDRIKLLQLGQFFKFFTGMIFSRMLIKWKVLIIHGHVELWRKWAYSS